MPSQILHTLFGEDVITAMYRSLAPRFGLAADKALEKIRGPYRTAFALGCQGPDIFYHSQGRRPVGLEYGTLLHRRGAGVFTAGLLKMGLPDPPPDEEDIRRGRREKGINALGVYALGFMTHAILDRAAHPYIIYKSGYHAFFERIIDVLMLRELRKEEAASWDQEAVLARACEEPPLGLKELLARALTLAFPERAGRDGKLMARIDNTFADCARFYRLTSPRRTSIDGGERVDRAVLELVYPEKLEDDIDFLNLKKEPWYYPAGNSGEDRRSFPELYAGAAALAAASITPVIAGYLETGIFPIREAAQAIGNGGLSIQDEEGRPCAPTRSAPLPLDRTLRRQEELRGLGDCRA
ncbi:MAG: zinc dependent phospholipase C family protein [Treponema sp.]|jgi:hypothetical protein|nr:zinc dependent phospholipase C family protein [Treponema sp.]